MRTACLGLLLVACTNVPGDSGSLGFFDVDGELTANSCGPLALRLPATVRFVAELRVGTGTLRWRPRGATEALGTYDPVTGAFRVAAQGELVLREANVRLRLPGCSLQQVDVLEGVLDRPNGYDGGADSDAGGPTRLGFRATETLGYAITAGSDCTTLLGVGEGQFAQLPCTAAYRWRGAAQ
ncbi:MAG: hypothetical protein HY909_29225 [Deltaproteobacteria bacterium]|nr:hypothetical protein [Deltaproteobacteria bacterium]